MRIRESESDKYYTLVAVTENPNDEVEIYTRKVNGTTEEYNKFIDDIENTGATVLTAYYQEDVVLKTNI